MKIQQCSVLIPVCGPIFSMVVLFRTKVSSSFLKEKVYNPYYDKKDPNTKQFYCARDKWDTLKNGCHKSPQMVDSGQEKNLQGAGDISLFVSWIPSKTTECKASCKWSTWLGWIPSKTTEYKVSCKWSMWPGCHSRDLNELTVMRKAYSTPGTFTFLKKEGGMLCMDNSWALQYKSILDIPGCCDLLCYACLLCCGE